MIMEGILIMRIILGKMQIKSIIKKLIKQTNYNKIKSITKTNLSISL